MGRRRREEEEPEPVVRLQNTVAAVTRLCTEAAEELAAGRAKVARMRELGTLAAEPGPGFKQAVASYHVEQALAELRSAAIADILEALT